MKKITLGLCLLFATMNLCAKGNKKDLSIKTELDSISYAYGSSLAQQGVMQHLIQRGVIVDTAEVRKDFDIKIAAITDEKEIKKLQKEYASKLIETVKTNQNNIALLLTGIGEAIADNSKNTAYNEGVSMGQQLKQMLPMFLEQLYPDDSEGKKINVDLFIDAMQTSLLGGTPVIENSLEVINSKMAELKSAAEKRFEEQNKAYIEDGNKFMEENKTKEGVVVLPSGLQYKVLTKGTGAIPQETDRVKVHYKGTLIDGTVFDSSYDRGEPVVFGVGQVIRGWTEALQLMPVGSKWMVYVPSDLGYGSRETGSIKPFSNLIFEVELLDIVE